MTAAHDTIVALATPPGRGGIGVIRVSGPASRGIAHAITGHPLEPRHAHFTAFRDADGQVMDTGIALLFAAPGSFTGEDVLEIHGHGSPVMLDLIMARLLALGARPARPGEFSQRAFLNGKLDLLQAEAIADLINSATEEAARSAQRTLQGDFSAAVNALADDLVAVRTLQEASIDFAEDLEDALEDQVAARLDEARGRLAHLLAHAARGRILNEGVRTVIAGPPNAGKSSLINALAGVPAAIVTAVAGTTRDVVRESVNVAGIPLHLADTAGLQDTADPVERLGIERTHTEIRSAGILLYVTDCRQGLGPADRRILEGVPPSLEIILVFNKSDLCAAPGRAAAEPGRRSVTLSALTGEGMDSLAAEIRAVVGVSHTEGLFFANRRHLAALETCSDHLARAAAHLQAAAGFELVAEELRLAHAALGEVTGAFTSDDLLDAIFSNFCIGK